MVFVVQQFYERLRPVLHWFFGYSSEQRHSPLRVNGSACSVTNITNNGNISKNPKRKKNNIKYNNYGSIEVYYEYFVNTNKCPIYVPAESVEAYKTANRWTDYLASRIFPMPT